MLAPLVLPEYLVTAVIRYPVGVHVVEQILAVEGLQDGGNVRVGAAVIAVGLIGAVAVVRLWRRSIRHRNRE